MAMVPKTLNDLLQHTQVFHAEMAARPPPSLGTFPSML